MLSGTMLAASETILKSTVKKVTVFLNSAQIFRSADFSVGQGISELVIDGVSPYLNSKSIQVNGKGGFIILDVRFRVTQPEYFEPKKSPLPPKIVKDIELLSDSLSFLLFDSENLADKKDILLTEKKVLLSNKFMQGNADTIPELVQAIEYLRKQLNDINSGLGVIKKQEFRLQKEKNRMETRLAELNNYSAQVTPITDDTPKYQIVVTIQAKEPVTGSLTVNYMTSNAGWSPTYDLRATGTEQSVQLIQKANIIQTTGEDWKNVRIRLSTITPVSDIRKPALPIFYLSYYKYYPSRDDKMKAGSVAMGCVAASERYVEDESVQPALNSTHFTQANQTLTNIEYDIDLPYTISSDGKPHIVAIRETALKAEFVHYLVPRLSKQAYLIAKVVDWSDLDLIPAPANIYFDGTYVGETNVFTGILSDTLELALGTDRNLIVERKRAKDQERNVLIGNNVVKTIKYDLEIKSSKLSVINLIVEDQLPIAQDPEIKIEKGNLNGAEYNEESGLLTWRAKLNSKQIKTISFSYTIEYNKNKSLANIN